MKKIITIVLLLTAILLGRYFWMEVMPADQDISPEKFQAEGFAMMKNASVNYNDFSDFWAHLPNQEDQMEEVVLRFQAGDKAWIIDDGEATQLDALPYPDKPHEVAHYAFPTINGKKAVDLVANPITKEGLGSAYEQFPWYLRLFNFMPTVPVQFGPITAIHEAFHHYTQTEPDWAMKSVSFYNRASFLPLDTKPRALRNQLATTMQQAWREPANRDELLSQARTIWDAYNKEYADEAARVRNVDIFEGTAEWVGYAFFSRSVAGWDASKEDIQIKELEFVSQRNSTLDDLGGESYELGLFAGLLLDDIYEDNAEWQLQANVVPLTELLLKNIQPAKEVPAVSAGMNESLQNNANRINGMALDKAEALVKAWNNGEDDMIAMDENSFFSGESISYGGHYITEDSPKGMTIGAGFGFNHTKDGVTTPLEGTVLLNGSVELPCGAEQVIMAKSSFPTSYDISSAPRKTRQNGGTLICLD